jgi:plasmid maintenance system antidote protein VapI
MAFKSALEQSQYLKSRRYWRNPFQLALDDCIYKNELTQCDISKMVGCPPNMISNYVAGRTIPTTQMACRIMAVWFDDNQIIKTVRAMSEWHKQRGEEG